MSIFERCSPKEKKKITEDIESRYGYCFNQKDFQIFNTKQGRHYLLNRTEEEADINKLRISSIGLYIGQWQSDGFRLNIDACHIIAQKATKNILEVDDSIADLWLQGKNIPLGEEMKSIPELKDRNMFIGIHKKLVLGCAKVLNNEIQPYINKSRRIQDIANIHEEE